MMTNSEIYHKLKEDQQLKRSIWLQRVVEKEREIDRLAKEKKEELNERRLKQ